MTQTCRKCSKLYNITMCYTKLYLFVQSYAFGEGSLSVEHFDGFPNVGAKLHSTAYRNQRHPHAYLTHSCNATDKANSYHFLDTQALVCLCEAPIHQDIQYWMLVLALPPQCR